MKVEEIKTLIEAMGSSDLAEMEFQKDGWTLKLRRFATTAAMDELPAPLAPATQRQPGKSSTALKVASPSPHIDAPLSGIVHFTPSPGSPPFIKLGQSIAAGDVICTIEAMKTFNEIRAERSGIVEAILVASGDEVDAGQPLVRLA